MTIITPCLYHHCSVMHGLLVALVVVTLLSTYLMERDLSSEKEAALRKSIREELLQEMRQEKSLPSPVSNATRIFDSPPVNCGRGVKRNACSACPTDDLGPTPASRPGCNGDCIWDRVKEECTKKPDSYTVFGVITQDEVTYMHQLLTVVVQVLESNSVKYWASDGTLFGAFRNQPPGIFKWDDDLDLSVFYSDAEQLEAALSSDDRLDWVRETKDWDGWRVGLASYSSDETQNHRRAMDIFGLRKVACTDDGDPQWVRYSSSQKRCRFDKCYFEDDDIHETKPCQFWDLTIQCPVGAKNFLRHCYGPNAFRTARVRSHSERNGINFLIDLEKENMNDHGAFIPGLDKKLAEKLLHNPNLDQFPDAKL